MLKIGWRTPQLASLRKSAHKGLLRWSSIGLFLLFALPLHAQEATPTDDPAAPEPEATEEVIVIAPAEDQEIDPPISIDLPEDWLYGNGTTLVQDPVGLQLVPYTLYTGPVTDGTGYIVLVWGYDSIGYGNIVTLESTVTPYIDALRILRLAVIGTDCIAGVDVERDFSVGGIDVRGSNWSAYRCEDDIPDARGWFLGHYTDGVNFGFYMYTEPIEAMDGQAPYDLQAILDTVEFRVDDWLAEQLEATAEPSTVRETETP